MRTKEVPVDEPTTAPTTFEPDLKRLQEDGDWKQVERRSLDRHVHVQGVIEGYQRQMAEAGYVVVRDEVLDALVRKFGGFRDDKHYLEARTALGRVNYG